MKASSNPTINFPHLTIENQANRNDLSNYFKKTIEDNFLKNNEHLAIHCRNENDINPYRTKH